MLKSFCNGGFSVKQQQQHAVRLVALMQQHMRLVHLLQTAGFLTGCFHWYNKNFKNDMDLVEGFDHCYLLPGRVTIWCYPLLRYDHSMTWNCAAKGDCEERLQCVRVCRQISWQPLHIPTINISEEQRAAYIQCSYFTLWNTYWVPKLEKI